jgi:hypothetical protein
MLQQIQIMNYFIDLRFTLVNLRNIGTVNTNVAFFRPIQECKVFLTLDQSGSVSVDSHIEYLPLPPIM